MFCLEILYVGHYIVALKVIYKIPVIYINMFCVLMQPCLIGHHVRSKVCHMSESWNFSRRFYFLGYILLCIGGRLQLITY
jgi:hypothetical protein